MLVEKVAIRPANRFFLFFLLITQSFMVFGQKSLAIVEFADGSEVEGEITKKQLDQKTVFEFKNAGKAGKTNTLPTRSPTTCYFYGRKQTEKRALPVASGHQRGVRLCLYR